jgi:hypothetical protein
MEGISTKQQHERQEEHHQQQHCNSAFPWLLRAGCSLTAVQQTGSLIGIRSPWQGLSA